MTKNALPPMPEGITPEWLTGVLLERGFLPPNAAIAGFKVGQVGEGAGMMSELSRLTLAYKGEAGATPRSLIAKYPSRNPTNRQIAMNFNLYEREVRYYAELDPLTSAKCPTIYHTELDGDNFIILMEDLADYRVGDQIAGADLRDTQIAIDELAKLHTAFWNRVDGISWIPHVHGSQHALNMQAGTVSGWDSMVALFGDYLSQAVLAKRADLQASIEPLQAYMNQPPITLSHGDFRLENFLYGTEPEHHPMAIIDWQGPLLARGMQDVALLLGQSTRTEVRRNHEEDLLKRYLDGLARAGVAERPFAAAWDEYRHALLYNWAYATVVSGTLDPSNERGFNWMSQMLARQSAATEDLNLFDLLPFRG